MIGQLLYQCIAAVFPLPPVKILNNFGEEHRFNRILKI